VLKREKEALAQAAIEAQRLAEEQARKKAFADIVGAGPPNLARTAARQLIEPCLSRVMPRDLSFDIRTVPIEEWLARGETEQIPWKFRVDKPQLRMDQRYEIFFGGSIRGKNLQPSGSGWEYLYVSGVSDTEGNWIVQPKSNREHLDVELSSGFSLEFGDCVFLRPGEYLVWVALYEPASDRRNVAMRRVRVPANSTSDLPLLVSRTTEVEFPAIFTSEEVPETRPGTAYLPIRNRDPLSLELIPVLSPPDQWISRQDIVRKTNNHILAAVGLLGWAQLDGGSSSSISLEVLDLVNRLSPLVRSAYRPQDWNLLTADFAKPFDGDSISITALESMKLRSDFFKQWFSQRLSQRANTRRALVLISGSVIFDRGSDLTPLSLDGACNCRIYRIRFRINKDDVLDDLAKLLKPFRPLSFDVTTPKDLRKALAAIVADLES